MCDRSHRDVRNGYRGYRKGMEVTEMCGGYGECMEGMEICRGYGDLVGGAVMWSKELY